jgi:hypothetical protein
MEKTGKASEYVLIVGNEDDDDFEEMINARLKDGWLLYGSPCVAWDPRTPANFRICQALIKP